MVTTTKKFKISYKLEGLTEALEKDIKELVEKNIEEKKDSYLQKFIAKEDAEITVGVHLIKNKQDKFEGAFEFILDGEKVVYHSNTPFKNPIDLVNHAFKHLKEHLSDH